MKRRDAKIAKRLRRGEATADVAAKYGITDRAVRKIRAAVAGPGKPGRKPTGAVTHHTARGRAALARLVAVAGARGVTVEGVLDALEADAVRAAAQVPGLDCRACSGAGTRWDGARFVREACPKCTGSGLEP